MNAISEKAMGLYDELAALRAENARLKTEIKMYDSETMQLRDASDAALTRIGVCAEHGADDETVVLSRDECSDVSYYVSNLEADLGLALADVERLNQLQAENARLREALENLVKRCEDWDSAVTEIIGRRPDAGLYLDEAKAALETNS